MKKRLQLFLVLVCTCVIAVLDTQLQAQAIPMLTDPIKVVEIELLAEKLELTTPQRESLLGNYDRYLIDFARVRDSEVQDFEDSLTELVAQFGFMKLSIPERHEVEKIISLARRAMKGIKRVDNLFFDEISDMLSEKQRKTLKHQRIVRELKAYEIIALEMAGELNRGVRSHFSKLCDRLHINKAVEVELILETYETRFLKLSKASFESLIIAVNSALDMVDELGVRGLDQQALMMRFMNEEAIEDLKVRGNLLLVPLKKSAYDLSELNWKTWKQLDEVLQEEDAMKLQHMFFSQAYRDAVRGYEKIDRLFDLALELDGISDDQHIGLLELQKTFQSRGVQKSAKFASILGKSRETQTIEQMSNEVPGEYDDELDAAASSRDSFIDSTETQIHTLLGPELVAVMFPEVSDNQLVPSSGVVTLSSSSTNGDSSFSVQVVNSTEMLQAGIDVPQSISPSFPERGSKILGLDESGVAIIDALYDGYRESFDQVHQTAVEVGQVIVQDSSLSAGSRIKQARTASDEAANAVAALDTTFFEDLAVVTGVDREDPNLLMLEHHRLRQRNAGSKDPYGWGGGAEEVIDLVQLFVISKNAIDLQGQLHGESAKIMRNKLHSYHEQVSDLFVNLAEVQYELTHMQEAMQVMAESANNEKMMESIQNKWRDAFVAIRDAKNTLLVANQAAMDKLLGALPESDRWIVRMRYVKKAYPNIFRDNQDATVMLTAALEIQNLDVSQRNRLERLSTSFNYDYWNICEEMITNRKSNSDSTSKESLFDQADMRREIQLDKLRFKRSELSNRVKMQLRMVLSKEQIKEVPGLHPSITAMMEDR